MTRAKTILFEYTKPYNNCVINGDFSNGIAGWLLNTTSTVDSTTYTSSPFSIKDVDSGIYSTSVAQPINLIDGHKYYFAVNIKNTSNQIVRTNVGGMDDTTMLMWPPSSNNFVRQSIVFAKTTTENRNLNIGWHDNISNGLPINIDDILVIDLTSTFGTGNEPTKEWCDSSISIDAVNM